MAAPHGHQTLNALAQRPPVSVCLAGFNGERFVGAQLRSVLEQLGAHDEVILSDDHSSDQTLHVAERLGDVRIRIHRNDRPLGVVKNFEQALTKAKHEYIFLCDQDDVWLPGKVDACVDRLQRAALVVTDCTVVDADLHVLHPSFFALRRSRPGILPNLWRNSYLGCCMALRRAVLERALPFPDRIPMHDMWIGLVAETCGVVDFAPIQGSLYRRHAAAASDAAGTSRAPLSKKIADRAHLLHALVRRLAAPR